jgi:hypothetical protein
MGGLAFDKACLWGIVGSFVPLGLAWAIYPEMHATRGFRLSQSSSSQHRGHELAPTSRPLKLFLVAGLGILGFLQLHFGSPRIRLI